MHGGDGVSSLGGDGVSIVGGDGVGDVVFIPDLEVTEYS